MRKERFFVAATICVSLAALHLGAPSAIAQTVKGTGEPGQVAYWTSTSEIAGDFRLFWDRTRHRLGLGTPTPREQLDMTGNLRLSATTASGGVATRGVIFVSTARFLHSFGPAGAANTFLGENAGNFTMGGTGTQAKFNTGLGQRSLSRLTTGAENTAVGSAALAADTTGDGNVGVGTRSLSHNLAASRNTAVGLAVLRENTSGAENTAVGAESLLANTTAGKNTAVGAYALHVQSFSNSDVPFDASNTAIGYGALYSNQPVAPDVSHPPGTNNTAVGFGALGSNTTGWANVALGSWSLSSNTTGDYNTDIGGGLSSNTTGYGNTAVGGSLLQNATGIQNTAVGLLALALNVEGNGNVAAGYRAGVEAEGHGNVYLGLEAGCLNTGNRNVFIGLRAGCGVGPTDDTLLVANDYGHALVSGRFDTGRVGINDVWDPTVALDVNGQIRSHTLAAGSVCADATGVLQSCTSDERLKKNVADLAGGMDVLDAVRHLRAVTFDWDTSTEAARGMGDERAVGLIAQEVAAVLPQAVHTTPNGYRSVDYAALSAFLVEVAKAQQAEIVALKATLARLAERLAAQGSN